MIAAPPLLAGAFQLSVTLWLPGDATSDSGALGTVRGTALTTLLGALQPAALWARMRNEYFVPLTNEPTV